MTGTRKQRKGVPSYDDKYSSGGGWKYEYDSEVKRLTEITQALGMHRGDAVLEIGCGEGFHARLLHDLGFRVTANDLSEPAIRAARQLHPMVNYIQGDTLSLLDLMPAEHFDLILARGHSWYHYHLSVPNPRGVDVPGHTSKMFQLLKPGGHFVLVIRSDFTGTHPKHRTSNNTRQAYVDLFSPLGEIVHLTDMVGTPLPDEQAARASGNGIVIATRKRDDARRQRSFRVALARVLTRLGRPRAQT